MAWILTLCQGLYLLVNVLLMSYGAHYWYITWQFWSAKSAAQFALEEKSKNKDGPPAVLDPIGDCTTQSPITLSPDFVWPMVTIQLPIFNEGSVVSRLIDACLNLDYPRNKLEIQVLDDSTDDTPDIVRATIAKHGDNPKFPVYHIQRTDRTGYKAGALHEGLEVSKGEYVTIFDADFIPEPSYVKDIMPHFFMDEHKENPYYKSGNGDKGLCCVQVRWGFINRDYSLLTRLQAVAIDGHFIIEQPARYEGGFLLNFNGTGGMWKRSAIDEAGGWQHDTLAEDLDLSYRAQFLGYQIKYVPTIVAPSEVPPSMSAFRKQQQRWAKGTMQCLRKHIANVWLRHPTLTFWQRVECTFHLSGYLINLLMALAVALTFPVVVWYEDPELTKMVKQLAPVMMLIAVGPSMLYLSSQVSYMRAKPVRILYLPLLVLIGYGLAFSNSKAVIDGMLTKGGKFERTPKFGMSQQSKDNIFANQSNVAQSTGGAKSEADRKKVKKADEDDVSHLFPKTELISLMCLLLAWTPKLYKPGAFELNGGDLWVGIYVLAAVFMIYFGMQDVAAQKEANRLARLNAGAQHV